MIRSQGPALPVRTVPIFRGLIVGEASGFFRGRTFNARGEFGGYFFFDNVPDPVRYGALDSERRAELAMKKGSAMKKVLNVGGNTKRIAIPAQYDGWQHDLLDIDPSVKPDIVADARNLFQLPRADYDAVYCSHNLEHFYLHDAKKVLRGFKHVLKPDGHAHIIVPDLQQVMRRVVNGKLDIMDVLYTSPAGPIRVLDVLYGHQGIIESSGQEYFAHKMGFTPTSLNRLLTQAGFPMVTLSTGRYSVSAIAFLRRPSEYRFKAFDIRFEDAIA